MEGVAPRVADHLAAVRALNRREHRRGVPPRSPPRLDESVVAAPREPGLEEQQLRRPRDPTGAKCPEDRGLEPGIRVLQAPHIWPVEAAAPGRGRLTVGEPLRAWQARDQRPPPRRQ